MITKEEEKEFKKPQLYRIWNFLIYGSSIAIGVFLVYLYSFSFLEALPFALNTKVIVRAALNITASINRCGEIFIS